MRYLILFLCFALRFQLVHAQGCKETNLFNTTQKRNILNEYINECKRKHYFFYDKGVVQLVSYQDTQGNTCWLLSALVDNRFLSSPPQQYSWLGNDLVLIYQGNNQGRLISVKNPSSDLRECISELVGGRVYDYNQKPQYSYYIDSKGVKSKTLVKHDILGNVNNEIIYIFNPDGTFTKKIPA